MDFCDGFIDLGAVNWSLLPPSCLQNGDNRQERWRRNLFLTRVRWSVDLVKPIKEPYHGSWFFFLEWPDKTDKSCHELLYIVPFPSYSLAGSCWRIQTQKKKSTLCTFASRLCQISLTNGCGCGIKRRGLKATASPKLTLSRFSALVTNSVHQRPLNQNKSVSARGSIKSLTYADSAASIGAGSQGCSSLQVRQNQIWVKKKTKNQHLYVCSGSEVQCIYPSVLFVWK